jgi:hypothetical protein
MPLWEIKLMRAVKFLAFLFAVTLLAPLPALAANCNPFASYTCTNGISDNIQFSGTGFTGQSVNISLGDNTFSLSLNGSAASNFSGDSLVILAAAPNGLTGTIGFTGSAGVSFSSLSSFPFSSANGAIADTWTGLGITANNIQYGYANLGAVTSANMSLTASGVGQGTILYAVLVNSEGQILYKSPNSESGVLQGNTSVTPEPASLTLLGTGLAGLAGLLRRKAAKR